MFVTKRVLRSEVRGDLVASKARMDLSRLQEIQKQARLGKAARRSKICLLSAPALYPPSAGSRARSARCHRCVSPAVRAGTC